jgi:hypothetical protein
LVSARVVANQHRANGGSKIAIGIKNFIVIVDKFNVIKIIRGVNRIRAILTS